MANGATTVNAYVLPEVGADADAWGTHLNANFTQLDGQLGGAVALTRPIVGPTPTSGAGGYASIRLPHGTAPTTNLTNGDLFTTSLAPFIRENGATHQIMTATSAGTAGQLLTSAGAGTIPVWATNTTDIAFVIDGGGNVITTGIKGDLQIDFACTIVANTVLADQSGSIVINVWKDTYANYPPTVADKITASAPPTISTATKSTDSTLTGWTLTIAAGDTLRFNVDSVTTITRAVLILKVTKS